MKFIPKVDFIYWLMMIIATTTGEIVGNYISRDLGLGYKTGAIILVIVYLLVILYSIFSQSLKPLLYWILIIIGNIAGTNIADLICIDLNLGTIYGSLLVIFFFAIILLPMALLNVEKSDRIKKILALLYWLAILSSSTFGTTSGDFLSNDTPLGADGGTILLILLLIIAILLAHFKKISKTIFYWSAIIIIHPIGATFGNYISKPAGLNFGNVYTSISLILLFTTIYYFNENIKNENIQ